MSWYKRDVKKQRFQVRYWVVSNIFSFFFILVEKNLLRNFLSVAKMSSLVYERKNCLAEAARAISAF